MKVNVNLYGQFLLSSQINYTCTYLADHFEGLTHENVQYFLKSNRFTPRMVWKSIKNTIELTAKGYIIFDDTVLNKEYSRKIELVRKQYSGNAHGLINGIGVVNCVYYNPDNEQFYVLDYRIFSPDRDGKTKLDHVLDMLAGLKTRHIPYNTVLMDCWYAAQEVFKYLIGQQKLFYCPIKANRKIDDTQGQGPYKQVQEAFWTSQDIVSGKTIQLHKMPMDAYFKLFRLLVTPTRTDYIMTHDISQQNKDAAEKESNIRWMVEQFDREDKQVTGIEFCQCRLQRSQRNHIAIAMLVWVRLKKVAYAGKQTIYALKQSLLDEYMSQQLRNPSITFA